MHHVENRPNRKSHKVHDSAEPSSEWLQGCHSTWLGCPSTASHLVFPIFHPHQWWLQTTNRKSHKVHDSAEPSSERLRGCHSTWLGCPSTAEVLLTSPCDARHLCSLSSPLCNTIRTSCYNNGSQRSHHCCSPTTNVEFIDCCEAALQITLTTSSIPQRACQ